MGEGEEEGAAETLGEDDEGHADGGCFGRKTVLDGDNWLKGDVSDELQLGEQEEVRMSYHLHTTTSANTGNNLVPDPFSNGGTGQKCAHQPRSYRCQNTTTNTPWQIVPKATNYELLATNYVIRDLISYLQFPKLSQAPSGSGFPVIDRHRSTSV